MPDGEKDTIVPLVHEKGLYFIDAFLGPPTDAVKHECYVTHLVDRRALLWAARLHGTASTLTNARRIAPDIPQITPAMREQLRADVAVKLANERRRGVAKGTPADKRATKPGERIVCDCSGPFAQACVVTGGTFELSAICEYTTRGWAEPAKEHTVETWMDFLRTVVLDCKKHRHVVLVMRFDRAPELRSDKLRKRLERELGVTVELAPRNHHEGVGLAEVFNDRRERMAEAFCRRASKPLSYMLQARRYAQFILNCRQKRGRSKTRFEEFTGAVLDMHARPPYIFGTWCTFLNEELSRGPKGAGGRASQGEMMGMTDSGAYIVRKKDGGVVEQRNITVVDEWKLLDNGLANRCTSNDAQRLKPMSRAYRKRWRCSPTNRWHHGRPSHRSTSHARRISQRCCSSASTSNGPTTAATLADASSSTERVRRTASKSTASNTTTRADGGTEA